MSIFEKATRLRLRFTGVKGNLSTEELWSLTLEELNTIAKGLNKEIKTSAEEDYLEEKSSSDVVTQLKFDVVLHILNTKKAEKEEAKNAKAKRLERDKLLALLEKKQDESLEGLSVDDIKKKISELS